MAIFEPDGTVHHLGLKKGAVGRYVLLPGDPGRVEVIARRFDNPRFVAQKREYTTWVGELDGVPVACTSTGIGCPSTAIAAEELHAIGADTFIRVGTSGGMQPDMQTGDLAVISGAIRDEGTSSHYLPMEFPAVADLDVVLAMRSTERSSQGVCRWPTISRVAGRPGLAAAQSAPRWSRRPSLSSRQPCAHARAASWSALGAPQ
jgi:uridine phosphorylase